MNLVLLDSADAHQLLPATDERSRHITRVLRADDGDTISVGVRDGMCGRAQIAITPEGVTLACTWDHPSPELLPVHVILGHPRPPVLTRLWRDLASMRVGRIDVFHGVLSERSYFDSRVWNEVAAVLDQGLSQGRHTRRPIVHRRSSLAAALAGRDPEVLTLFGDLPDEESRAADEILGSTARSVWPIGLHTALAEVAQRGAVALVIGPERGLAADERRLLDEAGAQPVTLGATSLRTETAAIIFAGACAERLTPLSR